MTRPESGGRSMLTGDRPGVTEESAGDNRGDGRRQPGNRPGATEGTGRGQLRGSAGGNGAIASGGRGNGAPAQLTGNNSI